MTTIFIDVTPLDQLWELETKIDRICFNEFKMNILRSPSWPKGRSIGKGPWDCGMSFCQLFSSCLLTTREGWLYIANTLSTWHAQKFSCSQLILSRPWSWIEISIPLILMMTFISDDNIIILINVERLINFRSCPSGPAWCCGGRRDIRSRFLRSWFPVFPLPSTGHNFAVWTYRWSRAKK